MTDIAILGHDPNPDPGNPPSDQPLGQRGRSSKSHTAVVGVVFAASLLVACSPASGGAGSDGVPAVPSTAMPSPTGAPPHVAPITEDDVPDTPLLDALLHTRIDGRMPLDGALTAFASTYGGLPGVESSPLDAEGIEGTTAARWLSSHAADLTDEQRAAVDAAMTPLDVDGAPVADSGTRTRPEGIAMFRPSPHLASVLGERGCFGGAFPFSDAPGAGKYRDLVARALGELDALLGPLDIPVYTAFSDFEGINADLNPWAPDCNQPAQACQIRLAPLALKMNEEALVKTFGHELTHCYQARAVGATATAAMPDWLIEGFPSFIAETVGATIGADVPNYWWDKWFKYPGAPLYGRTYDALGFYAVVEQAGGDPIENYLTALATRDSSAAFHELIGDVTDHFGTIWGATHFRQEQRGLFWELDGPGVTGYQPAIPTAIISDGGGYASAPAEAQAESDMFDLQAEVVIVELDGPAKGRYSFDDQADDVITGPLEWCTLGYPCVCPDDTTRAGDVVDQAPTTQLAIGIAGIGAGGTMHLSGMTFDDYCGPEVPTTTSPPVPPAVDECLIGSWVSEPWTIPGPAGLDLDLSGGAGIAMAINREGLVTTDFTGMAQMSGPIPQQQSGTATQEMTAAGGQVDVLDTSTQMSVGPGVYAIWTDTSRYRCDGNSFTLINHDRVESIDISVRFVPT